MVKKIVLFITFFFLISCFYKKNEYKKIRFNFIGLSPYKEKMILEDSSTIYQGYYKLVKPKVFNEIIEREGLRKNYLVFYNNGRVARFLDYDEENFDFNPKKAEMGYYGKKDGKKFIKFKVFFQGVGVIIEDEIVYVDKDSLITRKKSSVSGNFLSKYVKVNFKNINNVITPDW